MKDDYSIFRLFEKPEFVDACAAWSFAEWDCHAKGRTLAEIIKRFQKNAQNSKDVFQTWICVDTDNKVCGMASLEEKDHPDFTHLSPWLASVFVHPEMRGNGIVHKLCEAVEKGAKSSGFEKIYLFTHTGEEIYAKRGWTKIHEGQNPYSDTAKPDSIMMKTLH